MNGYSYQPHGIPDDRQPPSIPSIDQLQIQRPLSNSSPNPSQLPPLNQSYQPSQAYLPSLTNRQGNESSAHAHHQQHPTHYASEKTANLSHITSNQSFGAQPYNPFQYGQTSQHGFPQPPNYTNGEVGHQQHTQHFPAPLSQPPQSFADQHHDQRNLLPPFNPQPAQHLQQPVQPPQPGSAARPQQQEPRPTPVVGSQGRRGVLPSAPGRPPANPGLELRGQLGNSAQKQPDGKYACQYCAKVYLHLKHLKRHHLRHTGERPYQCSLCKETFCRSDILKRHFQKCSLRRGNPTGATHLTHAQAHLVRRDSATPSAPSSVSGSSNANGLGGSVPSMPPSSYRSNWPGSAVLQAQAGQDMGSARTSRSSSVTQRPGSNADDRKSFAAGSVAGTAPQTGQTSLNTSPSSSTGEDRKYSHVSGLIPREAPPTQFQDQGHPQPQMAPPQQYQAYYGSAPQQLPSQSQSDSLSHYGYGQTNGYQQYVQQPQEPQRYPEQQQWGHYHQYFQPGSNDPVMSGHHYQ